MSRSKFLRPRGIAQLTAVVVASGACIVALAASVSWPWSHGFRPRLVITPADVGAALHRAGLDPEALAAAGVAPESVAGVVSAAGSYMDEHGASLQSADGSFKTASASIASLEALVRRGKATENDLTALAAARSARSAAAASRDSLMAGLLAAATDGLSGEQTGALAAVRAARAAGWGLPVEYLVTNREDAQLVSLRDALADARYCAEHGTDPHQACQTLLSQVGSENAVAAAQASLTANAATVLAAWNNAVAAQ